MKNRVISLRLSRQLDAILKRCALRADLSVSGGLDLLLRHSAHHYEPLLKLKDCPDIWDAKLDVRIPLSTYAPIKAFCERSGIPVSVYIRKLLYHLYVTKCLQLIEENGHYTLACHHD